MILTKKCLHFQIQNKFDCEKLNCWYTTLSEKGNPIIIHPLSASNNKLYHNITCTLYIQIDLLMSSLTVLRWVYNDKEIWYFVAVSLLLLSILLSLIFGKPHTSQENFPLLSATEVSRAKSSILPKVKSFYFLYVFTLKIEKRGYALCK